VAAVCIVASCGDDVDGRVAAVIDDDTTSSPINALLGIDARNAEMVDSEQRAQASIEQCMAAAGFRYIPVFIDPTGGIVSASAPAPDDRSLEYVEQHGYGIADRVQAAVASNGTDEDPNEAIRNSLSPDEMALYDAAMSGITADEVTWDEEGQRPLDPVTGNTIDQAAFVAASADGCLSLAYQGSGPASTGALELITSQAYSDLQDRINADPEMLDLYSGWRSCMSDRGLRYQVSQQVIDHLDARAQDIAHEAESDHHDAAPEQTAELIAELRADEIELALADWTCSRELMERAPGIIRRYEVEFVREHEDLIIQILDQKNED
jgi:hypothetical protein